MKSEFYGMRILFQMLKKVREGGREGRKEEVRKETRTEKEHPSKIQTWNGAGRRGLPKAEKNVLFCIHFLEGIFTEYRVLDLQCFFKYFNDFSIVLWLQRF